MGILNIEKSGRPVVISGVTSKWNQIYNSNLKEHGGNIKRTMKKNLSLKGKERGKKQDKQHKITW